MTKSVFIVGATGSVGFFSLEKIAELGIELYGFSFNTNIDSALEITKKFNPKVVFSFNKEHAKRIKNAFPHVEVYAGEDLARVGAQYSMESKDEFSVINAAPGMLGLIPSIAALDSGRRLILANKESIIVGGKFLLQRQQYPNQILPVDTEHYSLSRLLAGIENRDSLDSVIITASGGPFAFRDKEDFENITVEEALKHPVWNMGNTISISSATMANKGLEIIEAKELFNLPAGKIKVLIHPEAHTHAIIAMKDGSSVSHHYPPTIGTPIANALCFPGFYTTTEPFVYPNSMNLITPDMEKFPMLSLAYEVIEKKEHYFQIAYTIANDFAVGLFMEKKIKFTDIYKFVKIIIDTVPSIKINSINDVFNAIEIITEFVKKKSGEYNK